MNKLYETCGEELKLEIVCMKKEMKTLHYCKSNA